MISTSRNKVEVVLHFFRGLSNEDKDVFIHQLRNELIDTKWSNILDAFHTDDISLAEIDAAVEEVRAERYAKRVGVAYSH